MPELRKDPIVNRWVIISTERGKRPFDYREIVEEKKTQECPLCEGNEKQTPPEILAYRETGTAKDTPGWWVRVVPNKFPALRIEGELKHKYSGVYQYLNGVGAHELIVESTNHEPGLDTQTLKQVEEVIWIWRDRSVDLRKDTRIKYIQIFKNTGSVAGASLEHTHSQLIALPVVPSDIAQEIKGMKEYSLRQHSCAVCDIIQQEQAENQRVILENEYFINYAPFASRFPFETWIVPKEHQYDFVQIRKEQVRDLARVLRSVLRKMSMMIKNIPYNLVLHTAPVNSGDVGIYHWHIEILPRLTTMAGFELGTGYFINPTPPEIGAQAMRSVQEVYPVEERSLTEVFRYV